MSEDAPDRIWLQWTMDGERNPETTWAENEVGVLDCDIGNVEYVRGDIHPALARENAELREALERLKEEQQAERREILEGLRNCPNRVKELLAGKGAA